MSNNIFERASRIRLRFDTSRGKLAVEDLWTLPLSQPKTNDVPNLDSIALSLDSQLQKQNKSFVKDVSIEDSTTQLAFDIVKHIIDTKISENKAATESANKAAKRQQIVDLIAKKQDEAIGAKSVEELTTMLNDL